MKEKKGARRDQGMESAGAKPRGRQGGDSKADKGRGGRACGARGQGRGLNLWREHGERRGWGRGGEGGEEAMAPTAEEMEEELWEKQKRSQDRVSGAKERNLLQRGWAHGAGCC